MPARTGHDVGCELAQDVKKSVNTQRSSPSEQRIRHLAMRLRIPCVRDEPRRVGASGLPEIKSDLGLMVGGRYGLGHRVSEAGQPPLETRRKISRILVETRVQSKIQCVPQGRSVSIGGCITPGQPGSALSPFGR